MASGHPAGFVPLHQLCRSKAARWNGWGDRIRRRGDGQGHLLVHPVLVHVLVAEHVRGQGGGVEGVVEGDVDIDMLSFFLLDGGEGWGQGDRVGLFRLHPRASVLAIPKGAELWAGGSKIVPCCLCPFVRNRGVRAFTVDEAI